MIFWKFLKDGSKDNTNLRMSKLYDCFHTELMYMNRKDHRNLSIEVDVWIFPKFAGIKKETGTFPF